MDEPVQAEPGIRRRTLLVGAAATAAVTAGVSAASVPVEASPAAPAAPAAPTGGPPAVQARDVEVTPAGDLEATNVEDALYELDARLSKNHLVEDLSGTGTSGDPMGSMTIVDDFMGSSTQSDRIGSLGWSIASGAPGTVGSTFATSAPGIIRLSSGTSGSSAVLPYVAISLGTGNLKGAPDFVQETRCRFETLGDETVIFGLAQLAAPTSVVAEPNNGCYFSLTAGSAEWHAVCSSGGIALRKPVGVANTMWHRFRIVSEPGAAGGPRVRFFIDGTEKATFTAPDPIPGASGSFHAPSIGIYKTGGTTTRTLLVDYFALRWEVVR